MSDKPRPWPNFAKEARDRSAEEALHIVNCLSVLIDGGRDLQRCGAGAEDRKCAAGGERDPEIAGGERCADETLTLT